LPPQDKHESHSLDGITARGLFICGEREGGYEPYAFSRMLW